VKTVSIFGASERRPSRLSEMPSKRPRTKSLYALISQAWVPLASAQGASAAVIAAASAVVVWRMATIIP
jgi:hypothetical protein